MNNHYERILKAAEFAARRHHGQLRAGNVPYVQHCFDTAGFLAHYGVVDEDVLCAAVLHDIVEDTATTIEEVRELFGPRVAQLVAWLTLPLDCRKDYKKKHAHQLLMMSEMSLDGHIIKIADKLSNVGGFITEPPAWSVKALLGYTRSAHEIVHAPVLPDRNEYHTHIREALIDRFDLCYVQVLKKYGVQ